LLILHTIMRSILIIFLLSLVAYYLLKNIFRLFALFVSGKDSNDKDEYTRKTYGKKEGKITIENISKKEKLIKKDSGEYIDYEEVK
jgi:hypothetical protein